MEKVDYLLEQMLPELNDLKDKKIFNQDEIREIIKRRTAFERALVRRVGRKEDFLRYIEYELNLEELRKIRFNRQKNAHTKHSLSSFSLQRRILSLFDRATRKFKGDVGLWIQYSEVAKKQGAKKLVGKILASALLQHPTSPTLYVLLSSYELTENLSPTAARTLLQRGLRLVPNSVHLWTEYAKMELVWVERLRRRWDVLGVKDPEYEADQAAGRKAIMEGAIVKVVWANALEALPGKLELFHSFLTLFRTFPTPLRSELLGMVYTSLTDPKSELESKAESWVVLARRGLQDREYKVDESKEKEPLSGKDLIDAVKTMVDSFKQGVQALDGQEKDKLLEVFAEDLRRQQADVKDEGLSAYIQYHLSSLLKPPHTTPGIHASHIRHLLASPAPPPSAQILTFARKATKVFPSSPATWASRLSVEIQFSSADDEAELSSLGDLVAQAIPVGLQSTSPAEAADRTALWSIIAHYFSLLPSPAELHAQLHRLLSLSLRSSGTASSSLPTHTELLVLSLPLLHPSPASFFIDSEDIGPALSIKQRLDTYRTIKAKYLPTAPFYRAAFAHERSFPSSRVVLEHIYDAWRAGFNAPGDEGEVDCHMTWLMYLWGEGESKGVRECLKRVMSGTGNSTVGTAVAERWQSFLSEKEREQAEQEEASEASEDEDEESMEDLKV
ncbi:HAT (Half-A-TPR) repeat-containing protein [Phaffia rhodozyma]|uniref:HAT (Half-A-TPR) repeat-containing protein n=1 Tax=Phaffia rhodozyma TaxID=264483 RepID=A0A0F7SX66_PHARH|nr:HAT (Half-A-TPR) repeat-containing protein [Phaffia rhodozyma]